MGRAYSAASIAFFLFFLTAFAQAGEVETNTSSNPTLWPIIVALVTMAIANTLYMIMIRIFNSYILFFSVIVTAFAVLATAISGVGNIASLTATTIFLSGFVLSLNKFEFHTKNTISVKITGIVYTVASGIFYIVMIDTLRKLL